MASNIITTKWKRDMLLVSDNPSGQNLFIDAGPENGGNSEGYRPKALMLSALAGCSGLDIAAVLGAGHLTLQSAGVRRRSGKQGFK